MSHHRSISFLFPDKNKYLPLKTWNFKSRISVSPSSHYFPKDMRDAMWIYLNKFTYRVVLDSTEEAGIWPLI